MSDYTEDSLVQQTTAEYMEQQLAWESVYAYNNEDFGPDKPAGEKRRPRGSAGAHPAQEARRAEPDPSRGKKQVHEYTVDNERGSECGGTFGRVCDDGGKGRSW